MNFVLNKYVHSGVYEPEESKLTPLLILKYEALPDAKTIREYCIYPEYFKGFQTNLHESRAAI